MIWPVVARYLIALAVGYQWASGQIASASFMTLALVAVALHADLTMLARLGQALSRARAIPLAA